MSDGDFKACNAKLAKLEAALRATPEGRQKLKNKPVVARIDAARRRLTRAQQRAKEVSEALEMAQRVVEKSDMEIACIESEFHDL